MYEYCIIFFFSDSHFPTLQENEPAIEAGAKLCEIKEEEEDEDNEEKEYIHYTHWE